MVAAILALGDIDFEERSEARDAELLSDLVESCRPRLEAAAKLLDVSPDAILSALVSRKINAGINQVRREERRRGGGGWHGKEMRSAGIRGNPRAISKEDGRTYGPGWCGDSRRTLGVK